MKNKGIRSHNVNIFVDIVALISLSYDVTTILFSVKSREEESVDDLNGTIVNLGFGSEAYFRRRYF